MAGRMQDLDPTDSSSVPDELAKVEAKLKKLRNMLDICQGLLLYKRLVHLAFLKKCVFSKPQIMAFLEFDFLAYSARKSNMLLLHSFSQAVLHHHLRPTIHLNRHILLLAGGIVVSGGRSTA